MREIDLHLEPNEASDLCPVTDARVLEALGADRAFVTVLDETPVEDGIALILHAAGGARDDGWSCRPLTLAPSVAGKTEDAEACAAHDDWVYVVGSQFGGKDGPLEARRSFIARLRERDLAAAARDEPVPLEVARLRFGLHRAINDALAAVPTLDLLPLGPTSREAFVDATIRHGAANDKRWSGRVRSGDQPVNVEAAAFRPSGRMLLGLRHPVSAEGHPLLVELDDPPSLFEDADAIPACSHVWVLEDVGSPEEPAGVRALHDAGGDRFDAVVGDLDAAGKAAALLADHPEGGRARSTHVRFALPALAAGGSVSVEVVRAFPDERRIEGLVVDDAGDHYVVDRDGRVELRIPVG